MNLIPEEPRECMLENDRNLSNNDDAIPVVKLFTPGGGATWILTELDTNFQTLAFGLCDLGFGTPELGYVDLQEIASIRGRLGLVVERDLNFHSRFPLSVYAEAARRAGRIVEEEAALRDAAASLAEKTGTRIDGSHFPRRAHHSRTCNAGSGISRPPSSDRANPWRNVLSARAIPAAPASPPCLPEKLTPRGKHKQNKR